MAQLTVTINGRGYPIACDDGQEEHLKKLAAYVDKRVSELATAMGQIGDTRLLVMACLLIADELSDSEKALQDERSEGTGRHKGISPLEVAQREADGRLSGPRLSHSLMETVTR